MTGQHDSTRRQFLGRTALAGSLGASAHAQSRVLGANDRINVAFIGAGMQYYGLLNRFRARKQKRDDFHFAAVCDVWQPRLERGQKAAEAEKAYRDYREVIARPDIDGVVIATPDHWHYQMASQALAAGKDVYLEKPMTYTIPEAAKLEEQVGRTGRVLQVGGTGPSTRLYWQVNEYIKAGRMGKIVWGLISYNRNTREGMWDYPIPGVGGQHWPDAEVSPGRNLDWSMWLGPARKRPYSDERYFRWRKYWDYSGGNSTDLLYHRLGAMNTMLGFDFPTRVTGAGGVYVQKNREVPDTFMTVVEYPGEYAVNMVSCMANQRSAPISVYGNWATLEITAPASTSDAMGDQRRASGGRPRQAAVIRAEPQFRKEFQEVNGGQTEVVIEPEPSVDLVDDWLECMRSRSTPVYNALRGYQVMVAIRLGVDSYRLGRTMAFDPAARRVLDRMPPRREYVPEGA
jgi:predicted dehydrogenase